MPAGATYEPINTTTLTTTTSFTFSSIPATYTDLVLVVDGINAAGSNLNLRINSDSGANYSWTQLSSGVGGTSSRATGQTYGRVDYYGYLTATRSAYMIHFFSYANTNVYKAFLSRSNNVGQGLDLVVNTWRSTSAINSITSSGVTNLDSGSTVTLYGIKNSA